MSNVVPDRKKWDKAEYTERARDKDREGAEFARRKEEAMKEGRTFRPMPDGPKPTEHAKQHRDLGLDRDIGKTVLVSAATGGKGPRGPGFYCELCNRTLKDSLSYLDHLNSRFHLSKLGQSTHVARSTVAQVRQRIAELREQSKTKVDAKNFDFQRRLAEIRGAEDAKRQARKDERRRKRLEERENHKLGKAGVLDKSDQRVVEAAQQEMSGIESMMGFGGFGGGRRK